MTDTLPNLEPMRPDFWTVVLPALRAARAAGLAYLDGRTYFPTQNVPQHSVSDKGWPSTVGDRPGLISSGPPDWTKLFGLAEDQRDNIPVASIPELDAVLSLGRQLVREDESFREAMSEYVPIRPDDSERTDFFTNFEILEIVGRILNRAEAVGAQSDRELIGIYLQVERSLFQPKLRGDVLVPLLLVSFELESPVKIVAGVTLEPLHDQVQRARAINWMSTETDPYLAAAATHALVMHDLEFDNPKNNPQRFMRRRSSQFALERVDRFLQCVYLKTALSSGFAQVLIRPHGWARKWTHDLPPMTQEWTGRRYPGTLEEARLSRPFALISKGDVEAVVTMTQKLEESPPNVQLAAKRAWRVNFRDNEEDQILDAAIGIEALVGKDRDELTHRMSQRAATALRETIPPENTYNLVRQLYVQRSAIVHGNVLKKTAVKLHGKEASSTSIGNYMLSQLLQSYLQCADPWTPESLDAQILAGLHREGGYPLVEEPKG